MATEGNYVKPNGAWNLIAYEYMAELNLLVVRTDMASEDDAQLTIAKAFQNGPAKAYLK